MLNLHDLDSSDATPKPGWASFSALWKHLAAAAENLVAAMILVDLLVTFTNTLDRYLFSSQLDWSDDLSRITLPLVAFLGSALYYRRGTGMAYTALVDNAPASLRNVLLSLNIWITVTLCGVMLYVFPDFFRSVSMQELPVLGISMGWTCIWIAIGFVLFALFALEKLVRLPWTAQLIGLVLCALLCGFLMAARAWHEASALPIDPLGLVLLVMLIGFLSAVPIAFVLAIGGAAFFFVTNSAPLVAAPASLQAGISSFLLVAVPFFLVAGVLMEVTGMAHRLIDAIKQWIGHWQGGLLIATIVSMYVFSGMSGSKAADVATVGSVMKKPLRDHGYPATESVAVLAASAAMGEVIPPSIALLILGSVTTLSIGTLFIAGVLPAALLAAVLIAGVLWRAHRTDFPRGDRFQLTRALRVLPAAVPALLVPVIVLGGIVGGIASPTESSSFAVVYALLAALLFYRSVSLAVLWRGFREASVVAGMVLLLMASASLISQAIVIDGLGAKLGALMASITDPHVFVFLSLALIIVLGFVLEGFPAILISAPLLLPIAQAHGVDPLYYGILLTMAVGIGVFMPPIGIGFYIACAVGEASPHDAVRPCLFYNVLLLIGFVGVILFPDIILVLPRLLGVY